MAEIGTFFAKPGTDITAMKEALSAKQQLLHKIYAELDEEREASKTAAIETLSMILRLQLEKAAVEMEANQYKRIAEEKLFHANESIKIFGDVIYQKDMEIASLECQIQAYKYKILSLGYDRNCGKTETIASTFLRRIESPTVIESLFNTKPKPCFDTSPEEKLCKSSERKVLDHYNIPCSSSAISNGVNSRQEITVVGQEELTLLKELLNKIQKQLSTIQNDIKSLKGSESKKHDDSVLSKIQEDMLHFWL